MKAGPKAPVSAAPLRHRTVILLGGAGGTRLIMFGGRDRQGFRAGRWPGNISAGSLSCRVPTPPLRVCESSSRTRLALLPPQSRLAGGHRVGSVCARPPLAIYPSRALAGNADLLLR